MQGGSSPQQSSAAHHSDVTRTALLRRDRVSLLGAPRTTGGYVGVGAWGSLNNVWLVGRDKGCIIVVAVPRVRDQHCRGRAAMPEMLKGRYSGHHSGSVHGAAA